MMMCLIKASHIHNSNEDEIFFQLIYTFHVVSKTKIEGGCKAMGGKVNDIF